MHLKSRSIAAVIIGSLALGSATVTTAQAKTKTPTIKSLKRDLAKAKKSRASWIKKERAATATIRGRDNTISSLGGQVTTLRGQIGNLNSIVASLTGQVNTITGQRNSANSENASLRGSLSQSVAAIAASGDPEKLRTTILDPAYNAWTCGGERSSYNFQLGYTFAIGVEYSPCTGQH